MYQKANKTSKNPGQKDGKTKQMGKLKERNIKNIHISNLKGLSEYYNYGEVLGKGVFGTVVEVTDKVSNKVWALKIVDKKKIGTPRVEVLEHEIKILKMVDHPHIIYLDRTFESSKCYYMIIEKCTKDLAQLLRERGTFKEYECRIIITDLSNALAYLHKYEIVHRDLKMENILTAPNPSDKRDDFFIKLSDFGLAIMKTGTRPSQMLSDRCGTPPYMAPEIIARGLYSQSCDVWAMGIVCFVSLTGKYPFFANEQSQLTEKICTTEPDYDRFPSIIPEAKHLLVKMLAKNPALRISATEAGRHVWLRGGKLEHETTESPENVLDMMQLWRTEQDMTMKMPHEQDSDWTKAFMEIDQKPVDSLTAIVAPGTSEEDKSKLSMVPPAKADSSQSSSVPDRRSFRVKGGKRTHLMRIGHEQKYDMKLPVKRNEK